MNIKYTISLSLNNRKHRIIDEYIKLNTDRDGRGLRVQPFIEQLLYECATSKLTLMELLLLIQNEGRKDGSSDQK